VIDQLIADIILRVRSGLLVFQQQIPRIIEDPRAYPREAMLLAVLVVLVGVFIILVLYAMWEAYLDQRERRRLGVRVRKVRRWRVPATAFVALVFGLFVVSLAPMAPQAGSACGVCHAVRGAVDSWNASAHNRTSCYGCHAARGPLGAMAASAGGAVRILSSAQREGRVYEGSCLACHRSIVDSVVGASVRMRHADVIEARMSCIECHGNVGHYSADETSEPRLQRNRMSLCLTCHDDVKVTSECDTCHEGRPFDIASAPAGTMETPMAVTCSGCHSDVTQAACVECHGLEMPHPRPEFLRVHAGMSYRQPSLCTRCHELAESAQDQACACHDQDVNIHGTYSEWFPSHGPIARQNGPGACMCHDDGRSCGRCHDVYPF